MAESLLALLLMLSVAIRAAALLLSVNLFRRVYDWRMLFLTILLLIMTAQEAATLTLYFTTDLKAYQSSSPWSYLPDLIVSIVALGFVGLLKQLLDQLNAMRTRVAASEQKFRELCRNAPVGLFLNDSSGKCTYVNPQCSEITGIPADSQTRLDWESALFPADRQRVVEACRDAFERQGTFSDECRFQHPDGTIVWGRVQKAPIRNFEGQVSGFVGTIYDVTESRKALLRLVEAERRYRTLVENAPEAILVLDYDANRIVDCNANAERLFKMPRSELLKSTPLDISVPNQPDGRRSATVAKDYIGRALHGEPQLFDWVHRDADGNDLPTEVHLARLPHIERRLVRGSVTDVRERKRAQEQLDSMQAQLAHVARLSTMGELVAGISHEISQPLYAISNFAQAAANVLDQPAPDHNELAEWIGEIQQSSRLAGEIIRRMRNFTKPQPHQQRWFDLHDTIRSTVNLLQFEIRRSGVTIEDDLSAPRSEVLADEVQIQQAVVNLVRNACDACRAVKESNHVSFVSISTRNDRDNITLEVCDNGTGIATDPPSLIFETFFTTKADGMGLGLAISRSIVTAHGGELSVRRNPDRGVTLTLTLPTNEDWNNG